MPLTLADAAKLSQDMLVAGVVETLVQESPVLNYLPWMTVQGSSLTYNQELTLGTASFYAPGDVWTEDAATYTQKQAALKIIGGDADVDNFMRQTYTNVNDLEAAVITEKAKAAANAFSDAFYNGDSAANPKQFDGLYKLIGAGQTVTPGANGGALTLDLMDQFLDLVKPGRPDVIFMSKRSRRKLNSLRRASGATLEMSTDDFGRRVLTYDGIPVEVDDFISDTRTMGTGTNLSTIYAVKFGFQLGVMGLDNGGVQIERFDKLETKDATRNRIKWYASIVSFREIATAKLDGIAA